MRWLSLLLTTLFVFTQVHLCETSYVLPSGKVCATCPALDDAELFENHSAPELTSTTHGDCHDCCTLQSCDDTETSKFVATSSPSQVDTLWLNEADIFAPLAISAPLFKLSYYFESAPPTGPPSYVTSRGPPSVRFLSSSAGRSV